MTSLRALSLMLVPFLAGCSGGVPESVSHSSGFFAQFRVMVDETMASGTPETKVAGFDFEFERHIDQGPSADEVHAVGARWDKVRAFLDIGVLSSDVMAGVNDSSQRRVDIFADASDYVLRSDYEAVSAFNGEVPNEKMIRPTEDIVWESLHLVLTESGHAERKVLVAKGESVSGYWTHTVKLERLFSAPAREEEIWVPGQCRDNFVRTDCTSYWVDETCTDVTIPDGYWESTCSAYDDEGNCTEWTDTYVDTSYTETQCMAAHYEDSCTDVYETVCDSGRWDIERIPAHDVKASIPGELVWVEPHTAPEAGERVEAMTGTEASILALGVEYVLSFGPDYVQGTCASALQSARADFDTKTPEDSIRTSRQAILNCLAVR